ncbi:MAG: NAD-glutamate dehydrogenase domain-containing protein, partial [Pseudomonadota bacterium]
DFSDIANQLSQEYHFWLDDAFASGGKTGYDHKRMGITARGAWESVKRHFRALHQDIENHDVTVIGIGDMAGDVFGNGMLLSKHIRLIAAFNHLHIFIDPHPNAAISFEERQRLFALPHSAWSDYNPTLISSGGGVFSRAEKSIAVSPEMKTIFNLSNDVITPHELIQFILKANVDLLYNGGIGTFVKATTETHQEAEDRHNDAIRIDAAALRCKVIVEGGNLGLTQLARVEFSLQGGRVYTDFIDNSAGVDCSDHEVNIKILLNDVVRQARLTQIERDKLLAEMTPQVAQMVLKNNYRQTQAIELTLVTAAKKTEIYAAFIQSLEKQGKLNRALEFLPDDQTIQKRMAEGKGFVRPEIAILLTYSKNFLKQQILASDLPEEDYFSAMLFREFPDMLEKKFAHDILRHHLRREIIATQLTNDMVDKMGLTFVYRMQDETGVSVVQIIKAYSVAKQIFNQDFLWQQLENLDGCVNMDVQLFMMWNLNRLIRRATRWLLRQYKHIDPVDRLIKRFEQRMQKLIDILPVFLMAGDKQRLQEATEGFMQDGVPEKLAYAIASSSVRLSLLDIIQVSLEVDFPIETVSAAYFSVSDILDLSWFRRQLTEYEALSRWDLLARAAYQDALDRYHRILTLEVLRSPGGQDAWACSNRSLIERWHEILAALKTAPTGELTKFSVGIGVLADFAPVGGCDL